jgi:hypothetical protein
MSTLRRSSGLTRFLLITAVGLVPVGLSCVTTPCWAQYGGGQDPGGLEMPYLGPFPGDFDQNPRRGARPKTAKKSLLAKKADATGKAKTADGKKDSDGSTQIKFSQDIAPILVANCTGCHSGDKAGARRGKLDLTTFEKLQKGTPDHKIVVPGKPAESHLVLRIKGVEEPRMPQGNNGVMSPDAIAKIEQWVKEGAKLDDGIDAKKLVASYAASVEQVRRSKLAKVPPQERDKNVEAAGLERWKLSGAKVKPEVVRGEHFMMFSNLSSDRASNALKVLDKQPGHLKRYVGLPTTDRVEKVSLFVFTNRKDFIEFVRSIEKNEIEADTLTWGQLSVDQPYVAVVDPAGGKKEEPGASKRKGGRSRRNDEKDMDSAGSDRTLDGLLTEAFAKATLESAGKPPRWLVEGIASVFASKVEPRSQFYRQLRQTAFANFSQGWETRASNVLGQTDQATADSIHGIGFALVEAMMSEMHQGFPAFVRGMVQEGNKLDETLQQVYAGTREAFLDGTGEWVAAHYGNLE